MGSPVLAPAPPAIDVTLALFGGTDTEISPPDVPEGLSPDNQDMIFTPGYSGSRPGMKRLYNTPFSGGTGIQVMYEKTFVQPNDDPLTLILTSDGILWMEDVGNTPGAYTQIGTVPHGLYGQSVSDFGREYIAISDLLHGQEVPLQFDGTNLDRVTMDGPGASPTVIDYVNNLAIVAIVTAQGPGKHVTAASETGNVVTITTSTAHGYYPDMEVFVVQVGTGYSGIQTIQTVPSTTTFTYTVTATGLGSESSGAVMAAVGEIVVAGEIPTIANDVIQITGTGTGFDNNTAGNPPSWQVLGATYNSGANQTAIYFSFATAPGAISVPTVAVDNTGLVQLGGQSSPGIHQVVCMFLTRQGYLTKPSPPLPFVSAGGTQWAISNLPIGPSNVVARVLGFTGAGGDNFFILPANVTLPNLAAGGVQIGFGALTYFPVVISASVIPDNTSTTAILDIPDNTLFASVPIDQIGNDLFDQVVLGTPMGFFGYASRLMTFGDWNKVENFLNMGFCGGYLSGVLGTPLGWTVVSFGGTLVGGGSWAGGQTWQILDIGNGNPRGKLTQSAYQDAFGDAIISPNTQYLCRCWMNLPTSASGVFVVELSSVSASFTSTATFNLGGLSNGFQLANFSAVTPATIPSDLLLTIYMQDLGTGLSMDVGELEIIFSEDPYRNTLARCSYVENPEAFAQTTGNIGAADDQSPIQNFSIQRNVGLLHTSEATHEFQDNGYEPGDGDNAWPVNPLTHSVGALGLKACDPGKFGTGDSAEDWDIIASKNGVYIHVGAAFYKVAQEMSRTIQTAPNAVCWDDINFAYQQKVWIKNDPNQRRAYIGVPITPSTTPDTIFVLDYREMDTAAQIAAALPIHITLTGKMKSSDMTRKWTRWNVAANCGEILVRFGNVRTFFLGGGGAGYGNIYSLDPTYLTDDDYGQMFPYYFVYFFIDHDQEQMLQLGSARKLYKHVSAFITGVGLVTITPYVNSLLNPLPSLSLRQLSSDINIGTAQPSDLEWVTGIRGQRVAFQISVQPLPGQTDVQMKLQKLIVRMQKDPVALFRGSGV
jgi:hypothetical protein